MGSLGGALTSAARPAPLAGRRRVETGTVAARPCQGKRGEGGGLVVRRPARSRRRPRPIGNHQGRAFARRSICYWGRPSPGLRTRPLAVDEQLHERIDVVKRPLPVRAVAVDVAILRRAARKLGLPGLEVGELGDERVDVAEVDDAVAVEVGEANRRPARQADRDIFASQFALGGRERWAVLVGGYPYGRRMGLVSDCPCEVTSASITSPSESSQVANISLLYREAAGSGIASSTNVAALFRTR